jgi:hypothetical protein
VSNILSYKYLGKESKFLPHTSKIDNYKTNNWQRAKIKQQMCASQNMPI